VREKPGGKVPGQPTENTRSECYPGEHLPDDGWLTASAGQRPEQV
jgi:hypothetical protein